MAGFTVVYFTGNPVWVPVTGQCGYQSPDHSQMKTDSSALNED